MNIRKLGLLSRGQDLISNPKVLALGASIVVAGGLVAAASGATGAYFSDTKSGTITGTLGDIKVSTSGGSGTNGLDLNFSDLLPGVPQTVTFNYQNSGNNTEDVWMVFPNDPALHALNNLGSYGEVTITDSSSGQIFQSTNLNDNRPNASGTCGTFSPSGCWPVPTQLKVRSGLTSGSSGSVQFTFEYASKLSSGQDGQWNAYPAPGSTGADAAGPSGNGLPYEVVATQPGITPGS